MFTPKVKNLNISGADTAIFKEKYINTKAADAWRVDSLHKWSIMQSFDVFFGVSQSKLLKKTPKNSWVASDLRLVILQTWLAHTIVALLFNWI